MTTQEITTNNILIDEFMGTDQYLEGEVYQPHLNWNELMPVVQKCTAMESWLDNEVTNAANTNLALALLSNDIKGAYNEVVEFIELYNLQSA